MILLFQDPGTWVLLLDPALWVCGGTVVLAVFGGFLYWLRRRQ
jgi:hypothetical protein